MSRSNTKFIDTVSPEVYEEVILRHWKSFVSSDYSPHQFSNHLYQHLTDQLPFYGDEIMGREEFFNTYFSDWEGTMEFIHSMSREFGDTPLNRKMIEVAGSSYNKLELNWLKQEEMHLIDRIHSFQEELRKVQDKLERHYINCTAN